MNLETRKLNLITYLAQLQDESVFEKIESYILKKFEKENNLELRPFTVEELVTRIEKSEQDLKNGKYKSQDDLEKIATNW
ncbi:MAG: hypothetical protein JST62_12885 [Bacteroidetes bacterium]|jgi:hypothetical protein|nr:hypothetical protein [Bacteroidota bacterium]